jgi:hypothetical protein
MRPRQEPPAPRRLAGSSVLPRRAAALQANVAESGLPPRPTSATPACGLAGEQPPASATPSPQPTPLIAAERQAPAAGSISLPTATTHRRDWQEFMRVMGSRAKCSPQMTEDPAPLVARGAPAIID